MEIKITTEYIKLQQLLKFSGLCSTGAEAKNVILDGLVKANGDICTERGKKMRPGDTCEYAGEKVTVI
jgi:ribosome-associated protein